MANSNSKSIQKAKTKTVYACRDCGAQRSRWEGRCSNVSPRRRSGQAHPLLCEKIKLAGFKPPCHAAKTTLASRSTPLHILIPILERETNFAHPHVYVNALATETGRARERFCDRCCHIRTFEKVLFNQPIKDKMSRSRSDHATQREQ